MSDVIVTRAEVLMWMDKYIRNIGDEDILDWWLQEGVPDGSSFDDLLEYAADEDDWNCITDCFASICKREGVF
jgi:hypothetical protein